MIDWQAKGFWQPGEPMSEADYRGRSLFDGAFTWPVMAVRRTALEANIATMAAFCARHGFDFAPHGKTTMAPSLFDAQLRAGAWAITVATPNQALVCRKFGIPRVILANEVLDPVVLQWLADQTDFECLTFVDSLAGVTAIAATSGAAPLPVLIELGYPGGRAGCRTPAEVSTLAEAIQREPRLHLAGIAGYEGGLPDADAVADYLLRLRTTVNMLARDELWGDEVIVSIGGSAWFDLIAAQFGDDWFPGRRVRIVLRSGAYVTHDHGYYAQKTPFGRIPENGGLDPALELWAQVLSNPEDGLAIAGFGKRDASFDEGLPVPLRIRGADGVTRAAKGCVVTRLNDQHAYVSVSQQVRPGELICFGISHPCTAMDRWRVIPVIEDDYTVSDLLRTYF